MSKAAMLFAACAPSAFAFTMGAGAVHSVRPTLAAAPQMVLSVDDISTLNIAVSTLDQLPASTLLAKSEADILLDEVRSARRTTWRRLPPLSAATPPRQFSSVFPVIFTGALFLGFAYQYAKKNLPDLQAYLAERVEVPAPLANFEVPEPQGGGILLLYAFWGSPIVAIAAVFAKDAGAPVPSPEALLAPVTFVLNKGMGFTAKTSMDVWNTVAPVIGLGQAILKY
jgi:hypothetical protein